MKINDNEENDNSTWDLQPDYPAFKEYFYIHRVKVSLFISYATPLNTLTNQLVNLTSPKFTIGTCNKIYTNFHDHTYSPLEVKILLPKNGLEHGKLEYKHWAYIDYLKNVIHVDGMYPEQRIQEFINTLKENSIEIAVEHTNYTYVEICCRHPYNKFDEVTKALDKLAKRFIVGKTNLKISKLEPDEEYSHLIKNLYIDGYCNIKTYKYVDEYNTANQKIQQDREPKLEIQLIKPKSLEEAKNRGVAVLKAITSSLEISTIPMDKKFEKADYTHIPDSTKISQNEKVTSCLKKQEMKVLPTLPDTIVHHPNSLKLFNEIYFEAKPSHLICNRLGISESTFRRTIRRLGNIIEKRGSQKPGYLYGIDTTQLNNNYQIRGITRLNIKRNSKGKALSVILLLIISGNILNSYYFSSYIFTSIKTLEDSFSYKVQDSYSKVANNADFFNRPYEYNPQTGLKNSTFYKNFTYQLGNSTQFKEATTKGGKTL